MPTPRYPPAGLRAAHPSLGNKAPHKRRASGQPTADVSLADPVPIEEFPPPAWRTVLNSRADLGYPDFYPSRPGFGQPEDEMSDTFVKSGFSLKPAVNVTAESFSMHGPVYQQLQTGGLERLMELGREIIAQRNAAMPSFQERAFRIPVRVTYNDTKRSQFIADLANPAIPVTRLMRNPVPHGFKGVELLETMFHPPQPGMRPGTVSAAGKPPPEPIPIDRALWFIRILGANEISAHRGRAQPVSSVQAPSPAAATPSSTATSAPVPLPLNSNDWYTAEFTTAFTAWLRMQLAQLVLPTKPKAGGGGGTLPPPKTPTGVLGDEKSRTRWLAKWQYSNTLLKQLNRKRLISQRQLVGWLADFLGQANLAQVGFVAQLIHENLNDVAESSSISRHCVRSACVKLKEIRGSPAKETMTKVDEQLTTIIRVLYETDPEVMLSPTTWVRFSPLVGSIVDSVTPLWADLERRNNALMFKPIVVDPGASPRRQQMAEIHMLDSICAETDMSALCKAYFSGPCAPTSPKIDVSKLEEKVFILVNWAMGLYHMGVHRPYAVYTMLKKWQQWHEEIRPNDHFDFFPILYKWLDTSVPARKAENVLPIGISFGELTRQGLFSYGRYLNTLISHGHSARFSKGKGPPSHHLELLRVMPIFVEAPDLLEQRRLVLSGDGENREREQAEEDHQLETFRQEMKEYVPEVFGLRRYGKSAFIRESIDYQIPMAAGITRFEFVHSRFWLFAAAVHHFKRQGSQPPMDASTYARVMNVFMQCRGYSTLADFLVKGITGTEDPEILLIILDSIKRDADVWTSIDRWNQITAALVARFRAMQRRGEFCAPLVAVLQMLVQHHRLVDPHAEAEVLKARERHRRVSPEAPSIAVDMDQSMEGLRQVITAGNTEKAVGLAPKMFTRHGKFDLWSTTWWQNVIQAVQAGEAGKPNAVNAAVAHITEVIDQAGDGSLRPVFVTWVASLTPSTRVDLFGRRSVPPVVRMLLVLIVRRLLGSHTLLEQVLFPELKHAASLVSASHPRLSSKRTYAVEWAVTLAQQLLLCTPHKSLPPASLREAYVVQTARAAAFHASNVPNLIQHLPVLVVLERSKLVPEKTRNQIGVIFRGLAELPQFKTAAFRNLDVLKDAFLSNDWIKRSNDSSLETGMVEGLKLMMSDKRSKSSESLPTLEGGGKYSAWRYTRIVLEMRVEFKRLTMRIANNEEPHEARKQLSQIVKQSLDREATPDDTDLLVEAFRGADSVVAQEILAVGLERLGDLLRRLLGAEDQHQVEQTSSGIDLVLRVISSIGRQDRLEAAAAAARDRLFNLLADAFQSLERHVSNEDDVHMLPGATPPEPGTILKAVLNLLRFVLSIPSTEIHIPSSPKPDFGALVVAFLHLAVALCSRSQGYTNMESMRDLLIFLVDSVPANSQAAVYHARVFEASTPAVQDLLARSPSFASALPRPKTDYRAMSMCSSSGLVDSDMGMALEDRPWEMVEQMVDQPILKHCDMFLTSKALKDTSSIPIALFKPQLVRDEVPDAAREGEHPWEYASSERNLGNGFGGEPIAARQAATILYARKDGNVGDQPTLVMPPTPAKVKRLNPRNSTPVKGAGTNNDPISIESDESEEEEEEPRPASKRPRTGSKTSTGSTRQVTGGKAPRKAAPARKAPAKNVRSTSGKEVKGRRKSGQEQ
ncbi:hypothetical protein CC85DRAFT_283709 [Cutaneotrichosporon oleaginosum]|uniref:Mediator of RNA polymerase II transcription subunit 12 n=1 Tax=Cutaneotrichosporon oleaginosum TaxID=879819 RepID=A0A0J0XSY9_9TREE|nr:uncharacterized protein CC85DRAFT_283709 [Cutaneotrichosporon oleaginosum]KLT44190.1 hypothetical protein CC85DRAFT_283709 [Cutaneotrichosporon oleaginosum]TXT11641.1 hypothetical protein COLE_02051 [Cutaneotrichosporon oleaginosum]